MANSSYLPDGLPRPVPQADGLDAPYWEAAGRGVLEVQRCGDCSGWQWGPEWICHHCHSFNMGWREVAPLGRIYSWERAWHPVHPALQGHGPYIVVLVELAQAGNIRMVGNLLGPPEQTVEIGASVEAAFERYGEGEAAYSLVQWKLG